MSDLVRSGHVVNYNNVIATSDFIILPASSLSGVSTLVSQCYKVSRLGFVIFSYGLKYDFLDFVESTRDDQWEWSVVQNKSEGWCDCAGGEETLGD